MIIKTLSYITHHFDQINYCPSSVTASISVLCVNFCVLRG